MLSEILTEELNQPAPEAARAFADKICSRHGSAVAAVLFYGSCLRKQTTEGVLDFYVLVDSYRAVFASPLFAVLNAFLPPNVFYLEVQIGQQTVRGKYAVISMADFAYAASLRSLYAIIWGRFCQPPQQPDHSVQERLHRWPESCQVSPRATPSDRSLGSHVATAQRPEIEQAATPSSVSPCLRPLRQTL